MNCPSCNKQTTSGFCSVPNNHIFIMRDDQGYPWYLSDLTKQIQVGRTFEGKYYYLFTYDYVVVEIDYIDIKNCMNLVDKIYKLRAFN